MEQTGLAPDRNERRGLALAALIMSLVALLCAFIIGWRIFALVVAGAALVVAVFVMTRVQRAGRSRTMSLLAIIFSLAAAALAGYYLSKAVDEEPREVPSELHDSSAVPPDDETLDKLRMSMDSSQEQH